MGLTGVPIHNHNGDAIEFIPIQDTLTFLGGRVCKGESGLYYKGAGTKYAGHSVLNPKGYPEAKKSDVFYYGYSVVKPEFKDKYGIFKQKMQPYFSDFIGACGPKEYKLVRQSDLFERTSVRIDNVMLWDKKNEQYIFVLHYDCGRKKFMMDPHVEKLKELIEYMLANDWNQPWDKGAISDVTYDGRISDVADLFRSDHVIHKFGTVYALTHSMMKKGRHTFSKFVKLYDTPDPTVWEGMASGYYLVVLCLKILETEGINVDSILPTSSDRIEVCNHLIRDTLMLGRNCGHVEDAKHGNKIRKMYIKEYNKIIKDMK